MITPHEMKDFLLSSGWKEIKEDLEKQKKMYESKLLDIENLHNTDIACKASIAEIERTLALPEKLIADAERILRNVESAD